MVGLYLNPPENALVLCVDEKSQCQALEPTQPMRPLGFGYVEGVTHDFVWTATADSILAKLQRLCQRISGTRPHLLPTVLFVLYGLSGYALWEPDFARRRGASKRQAEPGPRA